MERVVPVGRFGVPIPGGIQGTPGCDTECSGLGGKAGIGHRLDLESFPKLSDPGIL